MSTVIPFPAIRKQPEATGLSPKTRARLEEAAQAALDTADRIIAVLDRADGDPDQEDAGDTEPDLGAPDGHDHQILWFRGFDSDREEDLTCV